MWKSLNEFYKEGIERRGYNGTRGPMRKFTKVPNSIIEDPNLTCQEKMLYIVLLSYGRKKGYCYPTQITLAKILKRDVKDIRKDLKTLNHQGYLRVEKKGRHNWYYLLKTD